MAGPVPRGGGSVFTCGRLLVGVLDCLLRRGGQGGDLGSDRDHATVQVGGLTGGEGGELVDADHGVAGLRMHFRGEEEERKPGESWLCQGRQGVQRHRADRFSRSSTFTAPRGRDGRIVFAFHSPAGGISSTELS